VLTTHWPSRCLTLSTCPRPGRIARAMPKIGMANLVYNINALSSCATSPSHDPLVLRKATRPIRLITQLRSGYQRAIFSVMEVSGNRLDLGRTVQNLRSSAGAGARCGASVPAISLRSLGVPAVGVQTLGQRFHGSNHIRQPRRDYRTRCG
jgi:hypothetical protein